MKKQLAIGNFSPLKQLFVDAYTLGKTKIHTLPHLQPAEYALRNQDATPFVIVTLDSLMSNVNKGIEFTTKGDFQSALDSFRIAL